MIRALRLFSACLADGRFELLLRDELARIKAAHRKQVIASLAEAYPGHRGAAVC